MLKISAKAKKVNKNHILLTKLHIFLVPRVTEPP